MLAVYEKATRKVASMESSRPARFALLACMMLISSTVSAASRVVYKGDLLFLDGNTLLATSPKGEARAKIKLVSSKLGPLDLDSFPADGKRPIEEVFPGSVSPDGRFSFNPANFNTPVNKNTSQDVAFLVVTDLIKGKVKNRLRVPLPGLPPGTNFNFQSDFFPPADNGDIESNLGYNARNYVAVGAPVKDEYPLYIILSAWSCKARDSRGEPKKQQSFTKYTYNASTGMLKWSGVRQTLVAECSEGKDLFAEENFSTGRALGAAGSAGYLIAGNTRNEGPVDVVVYKLLGKTLKAVFRKPPRDTTDYYSELTLLGGDAKSDKVKFAGVSDPSDSPDSRSQIRLFGFSGSKPSVSSLLTGFKFGKFEYVQALANNNGALYALTQTTGGNNGPASNRLTVVKIGPFSLNVARGKNTPTSMKRVFQLPPEYYTISMTVVGSSPSF